MRAWRRIRDTEGQPTPRDPSLLQLRRLAFRLFDDRSSQVAHFLRQANRNQSQARVAIKIQDCSPLNRKAILQQSRSSAQSICICRSLEFNNFLADVCQLVAWIGANRKIAGRFDSIRDHFLRKCNIRRKNSSDHLRDLESS